MELSPTYPSFLDMRNAVLQADLVTRRGADTAALWKVFAQRGMGFFAGTVTGNDVSPVEDFSVPPAKGTSTSTVSGRVVDSVSGAGVPGAVVAFGGHDSGFPGSYSAITDAGGRYSIRRVLLGRYPDVYAGGSGYDSQVRTVRVTRGGTSVGFSLVRDWAASSGGASIAATNGDEYAGYGCGAAALLDQALLQGWSADLPPAGGKYATIALPTAVDVQSLQVDPSGTCGDDLTASTARYTVETSRDGRAFVLAATGTFGVGDTGHLVDVPLKAGTGDAVTTIRYTMLTTQVQARGASCPSGAGGCSYIDSSELQVLGSAHR